MYPEYDWLGWKFETTPKYFWDDPKNQRKFLDHYAHIVGIRDQEGWYTTTYQHIVDEGGGAMLRVYYEGSPAKALVTLYPELDWQIWKFDRVPRYCTCWCDGEVVWRYGVML